MLFILCFYKDVCVAVLYEISFKKSHIQLTPCLHSMYDWLAAVSDHYFFLIGCLFICVTFGHKCFTWSLNCCCVCYLLLLMALICPSLVGVTEQPCFCYHIKMKSHCDYRVCLIHVHEICLYYMLN